MPEPNLFRIGDWLFLHRNNMTEGIKYRSLARRKTIW